MGNQVRLGLGDHIRVKTGILGIPRALRVLNPCECFEDRSGPHGEPVRQLDLPPLHRCEGAGGGITQEAAGEGFERLRRDGVGESDPESLPEVGGEGGSVLSV